MDNSWIDTPRGVRAGEELDASALGAYLKERIAGVRLPLIIEQFPRGHSNLTYCLRAGDRELVLRRPPFGAEKIKAGHNMHREFRILSGAITRFGKVPRPLLYCDDTTVIGAPFYIMERVKGIILRTVPPEGLDLTEDTMRRLSETFIDTLAEIHGIDYRAAGLEDLARPEGYVKRQIEGWAERYKNSRTDDIPEIERAIRWLSDNMPKESGASLIHNDFKYDNMVLDPDDPSRIVAILDWEMATIGDPLMDLGITLGYWIDPDDPEELQTLKQSPTDLKGNLTRSRLASRYAEKTGRDVSHMLFYYVYALFRFAVIAQQIYYRYAKGFTKDERFSNLIVGVNLLGKAASLALEKGRIDRL